MTLVALFAMTTGTGRPQPIMLWATLPIGAPMTPTR